MATFLPGTLYTPSAWWLHNPGNATRVAHMGEERYTIFACTQTLAAASCYVASRPFLRIFSTENFA